MRKIKFVKFGVAVDFDGSSEMSAGGSRNFPAEALEAEETPNGLVVKRIEVPGKISAGTPVFVPYTNIAYYRFEEVKETPTPVSAPTKRVKNVQRKT